VGRASRLKPARLAEKLLQIRTGLGLSQSEIIREMGLEGLLYRNNISGFETGERMPQLLVLLKYARAAGVTIDDLVDDSIDLPKKLPKIPKK